MSGSWSEPGTEFAEHFLFPDRRVHSAVGTDFLAWLAGGPKKTGLDSVDVYDNKYIWPQISLLAVSVRGFRASFASRWRRSRR